jgi:hydroxyethylthiazole kinase-like uncharacterized protein yjeF
LWQGPVVLDADALNLYAGDVPSLAALLAGRPAMITPHVAEFARLTSLTTAQAVAGQFDVGHQLAAALRAVVLLKGVPTVITAPDGESMVSAAGTPVLAVAGSGDVLAGIAVTLLAQTGDPFHSAACAAWIHGRAAELSSRGHPTRGVILEDVMTALRDVWRFDGNRPDPPVLCELPRVTEN